MKNIKKLTTHCTYLQNENQRLNSTPEKLVKRTSEKSQLTVAAGEVGEIAPSWRNRARVDFMVAESRVFVARVSRFRSEALARGFQITIRVKCEREGGIRFAINGTGHYMVVMISNVGGDGAVTEVKVKGPKTGRLSMDRNWGQSWQINADLEGKPLSSQLSTSDGNTLTSYNVASSYWLYGRVYQSKKQFDSTKILIDSIIDTKKW